MSSRSRKQRRKLRQLGQLAATKPQYFQYQAITLQKEIDDAYDDQNPEEHEDNQEEQQQQQQQVTAARKSKNGAPAKSKQAETSSKKPPKSGKPGRDVIYDKISVQLATGNKALTADKAKELLGWHEEGENWKFNDDFLLKDNNGVKIRCSNNETNRPLVMSNIQSLKQDMLRGHWRFNGEPIIVSETGNVLNGQHTLAALILAHQEHAKSPGKWHCWRDKEIVIEKLVVQGVKEDDDTVHTIDTPKPRTFADVMYLNDKLRDIDKRDRVRIARMIDYSVKMLWHRTGAANDAFAPKRTHSEALDFIDRHPSVLNAVKHIYEEDGTTKNIARYCSPGYASALLYLMAASSTSEDGDYGWKNDVMPGEQLVNFDRWTKACEFWVLLASSDKSLDAVRNVLILMDEDEEYGHSLAERMAVVIKAWNRWIEGGSVTPETVSLEYETDKETQMQVLAESPTVGGIDLGNPE